MDIEMSDYPFLLAKLIKYFPQLIIKSYEPDNAHDQVSSDSLEVSKFTLADGQGNLLTPYRLEGGSSAQSFYGRGAGWFNQ